MIRLWPFARQRYCQPKRPRAAVSKEKLLFLMVLICLQRILLPHRFLCITLMSDSKKEIKSVSIESSLRINDNDFDISFLSGRTWPNGRLFLETIR